MKRKHILLYAFLLAGSTLMAQGPANRTTNTVVADVLAQMPAQNQEKYNAQLKDLANCGEDGVVALVNMMKAPGKGSNANVEYALSGLSNFVSAQGQENVRKAVANGYMKALSQVSERETKAFIIRQLQIMGKDECVNTLAALLTDKSLSSPAAEALASINTEKAADALVAALTKGTAETQKNAVKAIAEKHISKAEPTLLTMVGAGKPNQKEVLYALGCVGSESSLKVLEAAALAAKLTTEKTGANEAHIALIKRLAAQGNKEAAMKAAQRLDKNAIKLAQRHTREAAEEVILSLSKKADAQKAVVNAMKSTDKDYRFATLRQASAFADKALYSELMKTMVKAKSDVKVDIMNWIGLEAKDNAKKEMVKASEVRWDQPTMQVLQNQLLDSNFAVVEAAAWALNRIGDAASIPAITKLLTSNDQQVVSLAKEVLATYNGKINADVTKIIPSASDEGKIAGIELLALRKASTSLGTVLKQTESTPKVKAVAYSNLKDLVTPQDFTKMCGMLEEVDAQYVPSLQQAVIATIASDPAAKQVQTVTARMNQAGNKGYLYYAVLASTGMPKALQTIVNGISTGSQVSKDAALDALVSWKGTEAAEQLLKICQTASGDAFNKALGRYIELASDASLTGENQLIMLRHAMEIAKDNGQKNKILASIGKTGTFQGMMFAGQFIDNSALQQAAATAVMNIAVAHSEYNGANTRALLNKVLEVLNINDSEYLKQNIRKYLSENSATETGFVSIFNGKDLTGWKGLVKDPIARAKMKPAQLAKEQIKADEQMRKDWVVENGSIAYVGTGYDNICTEKQYADFEMYVDWMLDPNGREPDAGIYLRGAPQVQIWDTARVDVGAQVGSGGLYNNKVNRSTPLKVADNKLGEWNSFYIKMTGDRVTVRLNGELVVDDVILENYWDRSQPIFPIEQLELQAHGSKCLFRDIYVKELKSAEPFQLSADEKKEGYKVLFDGTNMYQWTGNTVDYTIEDGCISLNPKKNSGGNLYTKEEFSNFVYRFDFQLTPGANNGVGIRTPMEGDAAYVGMEIQILDCENEIYKNITPLQHHGSVYGIIPAKADHHSAFKPAGEWNSEEILADGNHIRVTVNGQVILDGDISEATKNGTADKKEHPGLFNKSGHIGFLGHGSPVKFRNIRIKPLK